VQAEVLFIVEDKAVGSLRDVVRLLVV
jgi:hypothetical protein